MQEAFGRWRANHIHISILVSPTARSVAISIASILRLELSCSTFPASIRFCFCWPAGPPLMSC